MLEIARGRTWTQFHTFQDSVDGPLSDLSHLTMVRSQIRKKTAVKVNGIFEHPLVVEVTAELLPDSQTKQSLSRTQTTALETGDYLIDLIGFDADGVDEVLLDPEPIKVINRPTNATGLDLPEPVVPVVVPDFSEEYETALED